MICLGRMKIAIHKITRVIHQSNLNSHIKFRIWPQNLRWPKSKIAAQNKVEIQF